MRATRFQLLVHVGMLVGLLSAARCNAWSTAPEQSVEAARDKWARIGPDDYSITISRSCECLAVMAEPAIVVVRDGVVESRTYVRTGLPVPAEYAEGYPSVEGLFDRIEAGLEAEGNGELSADYHPVYGYPTRYVFGDPAADAPVTFASDLTPL